MTKPSKGTLYLIPTPISENNLDVLTKAVVEKMHALHHFIAEKARTTRRFIKTTNPPYAIADIEVHEMPRNLDVQLITSQLAPLHKGIDIGLMSEAGLPCVADPGNEYVKYCHENEIEVVPMIGPSSVMLALMASGMNGQMFTFHGYLPAKRNALGDQLKRLEQQSKKGGTQIFIEAPYRNGQMVETALKVLHQGTQFCMAMNLTDKNQYIFSAKIFKWQRTKLPDIHKQPAIFLIQS